MACRWLLEKPWKRTPFLMLSSNFEETEPAEVIVAASASIFCCTEAVFDSESQVCVACVVCHPWSDFCACALEGCSHVKNNIGLSYSDMSLFPIEVLFEVSDRLGVSHAKLDRGLPV